MITNRKSKVFRTIIPLKIHIEAERFRCYQCQGDKAKKVYLNTLAVSTVSLYLNSLGWSTNLEDSDSWNPVLQTMMDVADLQIPSYGKLECRFVLKGKDTVTIPPEVWSERIGYVIVELEESLNYATVIGFVRQVSQIELPLSELESLAEFPTYLSQQKRAEIIQAPTLNKWFSNHQDQNWRHFEELFSSNISVNFRSPQKLADTAKDKLSSAVQRVKLIELEKNNDLSIALVLNILPKTKQEFDISLIIFNSQIHQYLPKGLEMIITDRDSYPVMIAQANETETIEFCFSGNLGENFSIEFALNEEIIVESFII
ncbi:MAG: DUF1822 family protein [Pleurocapsa sp.]